MECITTITLMAEITENIVERNHLQWFKYVSDGFHNPMFILKEERDNYTRELGLEHTESHELFILAKEEF